MNYLTRLALYVSLSLVLGLVGFDYGDWNWWLCLALFVCVDTWARHEGRLEGVQMVLEMPPAKVELIRSMMRRVEAGEDITQADVDAINKEDSNERK